jgi:REP element-mobilizing transposase RayT
MGLYWGHRKNASSNGDPGRGIEDHIHVLVLAKPVHSPSEIAKWLKADSSKWIHEEFEKMRTFRLAGWLRRVFS